MKNVLSLSIPAVIILFLIIGIQKGIESRKEAEAEKPTFENALKKAKENAATGEKHNQILLGFELGMTEKAYYEHRKALADDGKIYPPDFNRYMHYYHFVNMPKEYGGTAHGSIIPHFDNGVLVAITVTYQLPEYKSHYGVLMSIKLYDFLNRPENGDAFLIGNTAETFRALFTRGNKIIDVKNMPDNKSQVFYANFTWLEKEMQYLSY